MFPLPRKAHLITAHKQHPPTKYYSPDGKVVWCRAPVSKPFWAMAGRLNNP